MKRFMVKHRADGLEYQAIEMEHKKLVTSLNKDAEANLLLPPGTIFVIDPAKAYTSRAMACYTPDQTDEFMAEFEVI